jgi:hypothetical protein
MNLYDTKQLCCAKCSKFIGEVDCDAKIINALCGICANPLPAGDSILYTISNFQTQSKKQLIQPLTIEA